KASEKALTTSGTNVLIRYSPSGNSPSRQSPRAPFLISGHTWAAFARRVSHAPAHDSMLGANRVLSCSMKALIFSSAGGTLAASSLVTGAKVMPAAPPTALPEEEPPLLC